MMVYMAVSIDYVVAVVCSCIFTGSRVLIDVAGTDRFSYCRFWTRFLSCEKVGRRITGL
jgi:hypothetical protein